MKSFLELIVPLVFVFSAGFVTGSFKSHLAHVLCRDCLKRLPLKED